MSAGPAHFEREKEPVELFMRMPITERASLSSLKEVMVPSVSGTLVPLSELVTVKEGIDDKTIYHKNLKRVTYVIVMWQAPKRALSMSSSR